MAVNITTLPLFAYPFYEQSLSSNCNISEPIGQAQMPIIYLSSVRFCYLCRFCRYSGYILPEKLLSKREYIIRAHKLIDVYKYKQQPEILLNQQLNNGRKFWIVFP